MYENPDDTTTEHTPDHNQDTTTQQLLAPIESPQATSSQNSAKRGFKNKKKLFFVIAAVLIILGIATVAALYLLRDTQDTLQANTVRHPDANSGSTRFHGHDIPSVDCMQLEKFARDDEMFQKNLDKYLCYKGDIDTGKERISYVEIQFIPEEKERRAKACSEQVDCGHEIDYTIDESINLGEYIVRANGSVEMYNYTLPNPTFVFEDIVGCGRGGSAVDFDEDAGKIVVDNNRVGLLSSFKDLKVKDGYGNTCVLDLDFVSYMTPNAEEQWLNDQFRVESIRVHYDLAPVNSCATTSSISEKKQCFSVQATLRSDTSLCENLASPTPKPAQNPGFDGCIIDVAKKLRDPTVCEQIRYYREQMLESCKKDVSIYKLVFGGDIENK